MSSKKSAVGRKQSMVDMHGNRGEDLQSASHHALIFFLRNWRVAEMLTGRGLLQRKAGRELTTLE